MNAMNVTSTTSSVYSQYQNLIDGLKTGSVTYQEAYAEHRDLFPQTRGRVTAVVMRPMDFPVAKVDLPVGMVERLQSVIRSDSFLAAQAYANAANSGSQGASSAARDITSLGFKLMADIRHELNLTAYDHLSDYANANRSEWMAAANELSIKADGLDFLSHFFQVPTDSGIDIGTGVPNSEAERIFRHIASAEDVAEFNILMAPKEQEMQERLEEKVLSMLEHTNNEMMKFAPHLATLEAAGLTPHDVAGVLVTRDQSGQYVVATPSDKAAIENAINTNPDLRALYDAAWNRFRR